MEGRRGRGTGRERDEGQLGKEGYEKLKKGKKRKGKWRRKRRREKERGKK
jgi:hypothetical protein